MVYQKGSKVNAFKLCGVGWKGEPKRGENYPLFVPFELTISLFNTHLGNAKEALWPLCKNSAKWHVFDTDLDEIVLAPASLSFLSQRF